MRVAVPIALSVLLVALACRSSGPGEQAPPSPPAGAGARHELAAVPPPLVLDGKAYDTAGGVPLAQQAPQELPGLHNVFHLSDNIVSGSEPGGRQAIAELRAMGIRTIVSVDGKEPDVETAREYGMRYVHVPIQYAGIREDEMAKLAKTFRELDGPFYVHCFHGKHRGPAAAAVGRVVLDGASRETAIGEMRQYCGTSSKYEGLYRAIAVGALPGVEETRSLEYAFDAVDRPDGLVGFMVSLSRPFENVEALAEVEWGPEPSHPDLDALNEARKVFQSFDATCELAEVRAGPTDAYDWFVASREESRKLISELERARQGDASADEAAHKTLAALKKLCNDCHTAYRN